MRYVYRSLEDIALWLDQKAKDCRQVSVEKIKGRTKTDMERARGEAFAYENMAYVLRNCTIDPELRVSQNKIISNAENGDA